MVSFSLLRLCLFSLVQATLGLQPSGNLVMFASLGDSISLPCGIPSIKSCSSVNWNMAGDSVTQVVKAGMGTAPRYRTVAKNCFLHIDHLGLDDARRYTCDDGTFNSSVSLEILLVTQQSAADKEKIELHCSLNLYKGLVPSCNHSGIHIKWLTEANTQIYGSRFHLERPSDCFSKLTIKLKPTDHHRKWRCQLTQKDTVKTTTSYTTTLPDGVEEVFAVVGESVSFSCGNTSSLGVGGRMQWDLDGRSLTDDVTPGKGQLEAFHVNQDSSLVISKVSALHSGDYRCSLPVGEQKVISKIRLHTLDITSEYGPGRHNLTLTCLLTCAVTKCEQDFNLTWTGSSHYGWQSSSNNTLSSKLFLLDLQITRDEVACSVSREGVVMAAKMWTFINTLQAAAWFALPLGLLLCAIAGGLYMYVKRKRNKDAGNELSSFGMAHVYADIEDLDHEEVIRQRQPKRGATTTSDSFYDLLQAVN
uniref:uncharacterized protein n=1 Tax=Centroberyx gerrardi TaxID=166262 RepID=UPI003AAE07D3